MPRFRCQFKFVVDGEPFERAFELVTDGREVTDTESGRVTASTLCAGMETIWCLRTGVRERLHFAANCSMRDTTFE
jgi:hypothetical protein